MLKALPLVVAAALALAACGQNDAPKKAASTPAPAAAPSTGSTAAPAAPAPEAKKDEPKVEE
jgi:hypothetical protein